MKTSHGPYSRRIMGRATDRSRHRQEPSRRVCFGTAVQAAPIPSARGRMCALRVDSLTSGQTTTSNGAIDKPWQSQTNRSKDPDRSSRGNRQSTSL